MERPIQNMMVKKNREEIFLIRNKLENNNNNNIKIVGMQVVLD